MGRPFASELLQLTDTYEWASKENVERIAEAIGRCADLPLIAVGSGGSLSGADYVVQLHQSLYSGIATTMTPLEFSQRINVRKDVAVFFLSASGRNPDIVSATRVAALSEPSRLIALCMRRGSKVASLADRYNLIELIECENPIGKDGFLATNSLLATGLLTYRGYRKLSDSSSRQFPALPKTYRKFMGISGKASVDVEARKALYAPLWNRNHLVVLHSPSTKAAAIDMESKFTEAALGTVQIADFRNFAHGRHHWMAKRASETAILVFVSEEDRELARKTVNLIPPDIPRVNVEISASGPLAGLSALNEVLYVVASAGKARGIDPGRPGVPTFGRKLYHLSPRMGNNTRKVLGLSANEAIAISRKADADIAELAGSKQLDGWREAHSAFVKRLTRTRFGAIIFDYDGTLCSEQDRFSRLSEEIASHLTKLLEAGILIGIATGRGDSVRDALQKALPKDVWPNVVIGYHNGAEIGKLNENDAATDKRLCAVLRPIAAVLRKDFRLKKMVDKIRPSSGQVSIGVKSGASMVCVHQFVLDILASTDTAGVRVTRSGHSIDILAPGVCKLNLCEEVSRILRTQQPEREPHILCIGDRGRIPGNDADLLGMPFSLSVDQASTDPETCWNLAPAGVRRTQATEWYLSRISFTDGARISVSRRMTK